MTKHIAGIILFTFIVGTSGVIAGLFSVTTERVNTVTVRDNYSVYKRKKRKKRCRKRRPRQEVTTATITQASFDESSNQLATQLNINSKSFFDGDIDLHFFVSDEFGTQYLRRETISASSITNNYENSFVWLNRLGSRENLYIMATVRSDRNWDYPPSFDSATATPVLLKVSE